jgi:hypothetical protein
MKISRQNRRTARKLILPLIALGMMTMMMALTSGASV